ncbi:transposase family protein [Nocardia lijiangensis]|uniref:transposase family protein n=1 Tax=Nocardia lijiangensis TaxID=299618 RepID=UPI001FDF4F0D|nr:transposase family protein [Nocardia lijiangensis]
MAVLFPHLDGLRVGGVHVAGRVVRIEATTGDVPVVCPGCSVSSSRVHSRYQRRLSDTAIAGREVLIRLRVRRLFCGNTDCSRKTFAEQVPAVAARHARRTVVSQRVLGAAALALGGRAGARLTRHLAISVSRMTLLRQIRALPGSGPTNAASARGGRFRAAPRTSLRDDPDRHRVAPPGRGAR